MRLAASLLLLSAAACKGSRVVVTVENAGTEPLESAAIWATNYTRFLGDIPPGRTKVDTLLIEGETSITLQHGNQPRKTLTLIGYVEPGYLDSMRAQVTKDTVLKVQQWR